MKLSTIIQAQAEALNRPEVDWWAVAKQVVNGEPGTPLATTEPPCDSEVSE
jgi:hypothetical protein